MTKRLILALLLSASPLWATTYYVDNCVVTGNDSNNGTTSSTPWLTIRKVNASTFNPGDSILFQSTCTWREQLVVTSSGSPGSPITFGAYGAGAAPIINGSNLLSVSWTQVSADIWETTLSTQPLIVFFNGAPGTNVGAEGGVTAAGDWYWSANTLYVYSTSNPSQAFTSPGVEAGTRQNALLQYGGQYLTISNLHLTKANYYGAQLVGNVTVNGVTADYNGANAFMDWQSLSTIANNITLENSTIAYNGGSGLIFGHLNNVLIQGNNIHHNCWDPTQTYSRGISIGSPDTTNVTVQYNNVHDNGVAATGAAGAGIACDTCGSGIVFRYNASWGNTLHGLDIDADNNLQAYYNVVWNNNRGISVFADANSSMTGNRVYNNTVYGNNLYGILVEGPSAGSTLNGCTNNFVVNNIIVGTTGGPSLEVFNGCENPGANGSGNVYTYNDFGTAASNFITWGSSNYSTYATWEAATGNCGTTGCSHSVQADPQFVNAAASQFWLASASPAIDAGLNLGSPYNMGLMPGSTWPNSVVTGDQNAYGSAWEIGAFVYGPTVPSPPTNAVAIVD